MYNSFNIELIQKIRNKFQDIGCAQLNDASQKYTIPLDPQIINRTNTKKLAGPVFPVNTENDMLPGLEALYKAPKGSILFINNLSPQSEALAGDIYVLDAVQRGLGGLVINGAVRDLDDIRKLDFPTFSRSVTFVSAKTAVKPARSIPEIVSMASTTIEPGDWIFGDNDGILLIKRKHLSAVFNGAIVVEKQEIELKRAIQDGGNLGDLCGLSDYLAGKGPLKFEV
ncbi:putative regulator of ribonuclease activity [compost metagenome]